MTAPEISVVVPSHDRALRLRWLLNALEEQTLARERFEVVVVHDSTDATERLLGTHPLRPRHERLAPCTAARKRNAGWRAARAPLVAFTDDDCRPPAQWLERVLAAGRRHPGAIVQGATQPDPDEVALVRAPGARTIAVTPPQPWAHTCNIAYPRVVLEAVGGFEEAVVLHSGEDTDVALRARRAGTPYVGAPEALTYHCVEVASLRTRLRAARRWSSVPFVARRHPQVRRLLPLGVFWKPRHAWLVLAAAGMGLATRRPWALALVAPWARAALPSYGSGVRGRLRSASELPAAAAVDVAEVWALVRGSAEHRTLLL